MILKAEFLPNLTILTKQNFHDRSKVTKSLIHARYATCQVSLTNAVSLGLV